MHQLFAKRVLFSRIPLPFFCHSRNFACQLWECGETWFSFFIYSYIYFLEALLVESLRCFAEISIQHFSCMLYGRNERSAVIILIDRHNLETYVFIHESYRTNIIYLYVEESFKKRTLLEETEMTLWLFRFIR